MAKENGTSQKLSSEPITITVAKDELEAGRLSWPHLELAVRALHRDGLVVLEDVISHQDIDYLNAKMIQDAEALQGAGEDSPYNYHKGNIQQDPPATLQYFNPGIFLNPLVTQVTSSVLGPRPRLSFLSGNTALPPSPEAPPKAQPTHSDADFDFPAVPFALVINVPLVTMTPDNGSTEIWLGTHGEGDWSVQVGKHGERASGCIKEDLLKKRRTVRPPSQPVVKKGSVVVRDLRLWHGGMPNLSTESRVMLAMIHFAPWYRNTMKIELAEELRPLVASYEDQLQVQATFLPENEIKDRYLKRGFGNEYDFDQVDRFDIPV